MSDRLIQAANAVWDGIQWVNLSHGTLGGHAHRGQAVWESDASVQAVDGEAILYEKRPKGFLSAPGILVNVDRRSGETRITADVSGAFPFYYYHAGGGLAFSSLQRVLAAAVESVPDLGGCLQTARFGATLAGRSCFKNIARLLPGQTLCFVPGRGLELTEESSLWTEVVRIDPDTAAREAWIRLLDGAGRATPSTGRVALMMSGGWDSRTLLACLQEIGLGERLICYSHGDLASRELRIAGEIVRHRGVEHRTKRIGAEIFAEDFLRTAFRRTECLIFAHWLKAGQLLSDEKVQTAVSGVYGGVLGGHYGPSTLMGDRQKMRFVLSHLLGRHPEGIDRHGVSEMLRLQTPHLPWYVNRDAVSPERYVSEINSDVDQVLMRLQDRGITEGDQLIEAFLVESRGAQYMNGQNLSLRAYVDIMNPLASEDLLQFATQLRTTVKVHNQINRRILQQAAPDLLAFPLAATLVAAGRPMLAQEASRLVRKSWEGIHRRARRWSRGRIGRIRWGWVDFDFMKDPDLLHRLVGSLQAEFWDKGALIARVGDVAENGMAHQLHPIFDQLGKILTVDRLVTRDGDP